MLQIYLQEVSWNPSTLSIGWNGVYICFKSAVYRYIFIFILKQIILGGLWGGYSDFKFRDFLTFWAPREYFDFKLALLFINQTILQILGILCSSSRIFCLLIHCDWIDNLLSARKVSMLFYLIRLLSPFTASENLKLYIYVYDKIKCHLFCCMHIYFLFFVSFEISSTHFLQLEP